MGLYDLSGRIYDLLMYILTLGSLERFKQKAIAKLGLQPGAQVLDWGCGTGVSSKQIQHYLREGRIYAIDRSPAMLKHAVGRIKTNQALECCFILGNGLTLSLPEKVDAAVACQSLGVLDPAQFEKGVEAIWRNMKPNGRVAIVETQIPKPKTLFERLYQTVHKIVILGVFGDKSSDRLMPTIERFFEQIAVEKAPAFYAIAFLGRRRDVVLSGTDS